MEQHTSSNGNDVYDYARDYWTVSDGHDNAPPAVGAPPTSEEDDMRPVAPYVTSTTSSSAAVAEEERQSAQLGTSTGLPGWVSRYFGWSTGREGRGGAEGDVRIQEHHLNGVQNVRNSSMDPIAADVWRSTLDEEKGVELDALRRPVMASAVGDGTSVDMSEGDAFSRNGIEWRIHRQIVTDGEVKEKNDVEPGVVPSMHLEVDAGNGKDGILYDCEMKHALEACENKGIDRCVLVYF